MNITIVGGGFAGVKAALRLAKRSKHKITLITDRDYFQYTPSLYSTATGRSQMDTWIPLGVIFSKLPNVQVIIDTIETINPEVNQLTSQSGMIYHYDRCVLAMGVVTTFFGIKGLSEHSHGIKSKEDIHALKRHLYETIIDSPDASERKIVIIGGGPTGVELAAAMNTYIELLHKRHGVRQRRFQVRLIEASPRLLPMMSQSAGRTVKKRLQRLGVTVSLGKKVESATESGLVVDGKPLLAGTIIWTSGTVNNPFYAANKQHFKLAPNGRVVVDQQLMAAKDVYVIGDNAATPYTGLAQTALYDAMFVANNLINHKMKPKQYKPYQPPVVVPIGRRWAVFEWRGVRLYGWLGALIRRFADLIGYVDILPLRKALSIWHWGDEPEDVYFTPRTSKSKH